MNEKLRNLDRIIVKREYQYRYDIFDKLNFNFHAGKKLLDVGCGPCVNAKILRDIYGLDVVASDIYEHENAKNFGLDFVKASICELPFPDQSFDYLFVQDVLHHIDEDNQRHEVHVKALEELKRVVKKDGYIIIVEANRYNPMLYPHMVRLLGHKHFRQKYFVNLVKEVFKDPKFTYLEIHDYNSRILWFWKIYEFIMDKLMPYQIRAYNIAVINAKDL